MATEDDEQNPFTRPGFIAAAVVVALVVVLGIVIAIVNATRNDDPDPTPTSAASSSSAAPTTDTPAAAGGASVCGLDGEVLSGSLTSAPDVKWEYQGTVAYPTSTTYGPGTTDPSGFGYCFQRSPQGALFAAAHAIAQGSAPENRAWLEYFAAEGAYRDQLLSEGSTGTSATGTRLRIAGFRVLAYDGENARIDLAGEGSTSAGSITFSAVYELVWQAGDWKVSTETATPFDFASIPNLAGYITWGP